MALTDRQIQNAKAIEKDLFLNDDRGLYLRFIHMDISPQSLYMTFELKNGLGPMKSQPQKLANFIWDF